MNNLLLSDLFQVKGRFRRSVHLERDFYTENALDGYVLTATAREMLSRIVATLANETTSKAWSLTGPYGSGKSAFALFVAKLLGAPDASATKEALEVLKDGDTQLHQRFANPNGKGWLSSSGFCPVLISGERAPLSLALLRGLEHGLISFGKISQSNSPLPKIKRLLNAAEKGRHPSASEITALFESAMHQINKK